VVVGLISVRRVGEVALPAESTGQPVGVANKVGIVIGHGEGCLLVLPAGDIICPRGERQKQLLRQDVGNIGPDNVAIGRTGCRAQAIRVEVVQLKVGGVALEPALCTREHPHVHVREDRLTHEAGRLSCGVWEYWWRGSAFASVNAWE